MNNSETKKFPIKAVKVEEVICVLRRIMGQLFFFSFLFFFPKCRMWIILFVAPESFGCSPNRNLNNSAKQTSTFRTSSSSCFLFPAFPLFELQSQRRDDLKTKCTIDPLNTPNVCRNFASPSLHYRSTCSIDFPSVSVSRFNSFQLIFESVLLLLF